MTDNFDNQPLAVVDMAPEAYSKGFPAGFCWAMTADRAKLENYRTFIRRYRTNAGLPELQPLERSTSEFTVAELIGSAILNGPDSATERDAASKFWGSIEDSNPQNSEWLGAFCDGAINFVQKAIEFKHSQAQNYHVKYGEPGPDGGVVNEVFFVEPE